MRKIVLALAGTVSGLIMLFSYHTSLGGGTALAGAVPPATGSATTVPGTSGSSGSSGSSSATGSTGRGTGTVTGGTAQTRWGPVQVRLTVSGGTITRAAAVQYPNSNGRSQQINAYALPVLAKEVLDGQSAQIDLVSGATVTSLGYVQSLQSALDKANL